MKARTASELKRRCTLLIKLVTREYEKEEEMNKRRGLPSTGVGSVNPTNVDCAGTKDEILNKTVNDSV